MENNDKIKKNDFKKNYVTIRDVAQRANVSVSTVSRALRTPGKTPAITVQRVRAAASELDYVYNATAGSLSAKRTNTIGVLVPSPAYSAFSINLMAIQATCDERNYSCRVAASQFSPEQERHALRRFHELRVDGLILAGIDRGNIEYVQALESEGIPCVILWEEVQGLNYIGIDNERAAYNGVKYLLALGHTRIAVLLGPLTCATRNYARYLGYQKALAEANIPLDEALVHSHPPLFLLGKESMRALLSLDSPPTAVICANDYLAIGAIRAITNAGLQVPRDISVCGFDDVDVAAYFNPPLTTIKTPGYEMGQMAAKKIIDALEQHEKLSVKYLLDTELVVRSTCDKPPS